MNTGERSSGADERMRKNDRGRKAQKWREILYMQVHGEEIDID